MNDKAALDDALLRAHGAGDRAALVTLYIEAADRFEEAQAFYLTHAYVFALEAGDARTTDLRTRLVALGADTPEV